MGRGLLGIVGNTRPTQRVALCVVLEGLGIDRSILQGLADGEMKVEAILIREIAALELRPHDIELRRRKPERLHVGEAPVRLSQTRLQLDTPAVRLNALLLSS